jgi:hypothetical protein
MSADLTVVKSIKQRDLLNAWRQIYVKQCRVPALGACQPDRFADEAPDLVAP